MLKNLWMFGAGATAILFFCGCTTISELPPESVPENIKTPEYILGRELLMCILKNDARSFVSYLPEDTRTNFNIETFTKARQAITQSLGEPVSFQYLTKLEFVALTPQVWKVRFRRQDSRKKTIFSEALFRIVTGRDKSGRVLVISFNFL